MKGSGRTDDDDGALRILEQIIKLPGAGHQAIEIHLDHLVEIFGFKLRPLVHHHALRADENIQPVELLAELFNVLDHRRHRPDDSGGRRDPIHRLCHNHLRWRGCR